MFDRDCRLISASASWLRANGLGGKDYGAQRVQDALPRTTPEVLEFHSRAAQGEHALNQGELFVDASGQERWFHCEYRPYHGLKNMEGFYTINAVEITPLIEARRQAQANEQRLRLALSAANAGVFEVDFLQRSVWCSSEFETIVGRALTFDEMAMACWPVIHPDDRERIGRVVSAGRDSLMTEPHEARVVLPDGSSRWVEIRTVVNETPDGALSSIVGAVIDIDDRKGQELAQTQTRLQALIDARRLELALDAAHMGVVEIEIESRKIWSSPQVERILGQPPVFLGPDAPPWPMCHPDDRERLDRHLLGWENDRLIPIDFRVVHPSGDVRWIQIHAQMDPGQAGRQQKIVVLLIDIDDRKRQELALTEARAELQDTADRLNLALGAVRAGVAEFDFRTCSIWCSPEFNELIGRQVVWEDFADDVWPMCHPDDRDLFRAVVAGWTGALHEPFDMRILLPSGEVRWVQAHGNRVIDEDGQPVRAVALMVDIDARKRQELALERAQAEAQVNAERLRLALDAAGAGVFETNFKTGTFWCSPQLIQIVGQDMTYEEAASAWPMIHPDDRARLDDLANQAMTTGEAHVLEMRIVLPTGETRWIESRVENHGGAAGASDRVVGFILDIDERKRQELLLVQAEQAAQAAGVAKAQFLANMSHELRTPMNGVLGILHLLTQEPLTLRGKGLLQEAEYCGRMLAQLLNDVVDFSKIEEGRLELTPEPMDAAATIEGVARMLRAEAELKGVELRTRFEGVQSLIEADSVRLRQAMFNLIGNAVKFTSEGYVEARLSVFETAEGDMRLRLEVEDTGIGISEAARASLFQRFQQADGSTARRFGGSGLGLAITRALAEMMGGEVDCASREGRGSTFWFDVPVKPATGFEARPSTPEGALGGIKVLVVEDNSTNQLVITMMLEALGAHAETAKDGVEGLEMAASGRFDLVLMDVQMPRMDGVEATRRIRGLEGPASRVTIIGLTANVLDHQRHEYLSAGMDGVAGKPISPSALIAEIARISDSRDVTAVA